MIWICLIPAALLLLGVADMPIGYYTLLRIVVCLASCLLAYANYSKEEKINLSAILFGIVAILFNPFIPIYLQDKDVWTVIDILAAIFFIGEYIYYRNTQ